MDLQLEAEKAYRKALDAIQSDYRKAHAKAILLADKVQACLLDFELAGKAPDDPNEDKWFYIAPYQKYAKILKAQDLKAEPMQEARRLMAATLTGGVIGGGAFCHYPVHGLRFYQGGSLLYYTSCCWVCGNFFVSYPDASDGAQWLGFPKDDLEKWINKLLPIPEEELKRFKAKYPDESKLNLLPTSTSLFNR